MEAGIRPNIDRPGTRDKRVEICQHRHPLGNAINNACGDEAAITEPDEHKAGGCVIRKAPDDVVNMRAQRRLRSTLRQPIAYSLERRSRHRVTSLAQDLSLEVPQPSTGSRPMDKHYLGHFHLRTTTTAN